MQWQPSFVRVSGWPARAAALRTSMMSCCRHGSRSPWYKNCTPIHTGTGERGKEEDGEKKGEKSWNEKKKKKKKEKDKKNEKERE